MTRLASIVAALGMAAGIAAQPPQTIVFVCEHGAAKSVVAAAHFNRLAAERGLPFRAVSRGTAPDAAVPALIANGLATEHLAAPAGFAPTLVGANDVVAALRIVTFDVMPPAAADASRVIRWDRMPAFSDGYAAASAAIAAKVDALVRELAVTAKRKH